MSMAEIKKYLTERGVDAYVVAYNNRFIGQDILAKEHKLKYLCNFSGSAGMLALTLDKAYLLVDGRYELQAQAEVIDDNVEIVNKIPTLNNVCEILMQKGCNKIGYDAWCHSINDMDAARKCYPQLQFFDEGDLVNLDAKSKISALSREVKYAGLARENKISRLSEYIVAQKADYCLIAAADSVSWLLNLYSRDLAYSPIVRAYALVDKSGDCRLISDTLTTDLFTVWSWQELAEFLQETAPATILYDADKTPEKIKAWAQKHILADNKDICQIYKSIKNEVELKGMINCHIRDGVALTKLLCWLDNNWQGKTELDVAKKLHSLRSKQPQFFSESFASIVGSGANGAIVHYQPTTKTNAPLKADTLLLLDSGGQYFDGTTDVTRTIVLGRPTRAMIEDFTAVLKAHIALAKACFPMFTAGKKLDTLARAAIWQHGCDYKHGTGHGVACFGNVHEGPISISVNTSDYGFAPDMVVSVEPGIYRENKYGIRLENLVYTKISAISEQFLCFENLTKVPIDKRLIDAYLLHADERAWLNAYHKNVYECLAPFMNENEKLWLKNACSPL